MIDSGATIAVELEADLNADLIDVRVACRDGYLALTGSPKSTGSHRIPF